LDVVFPDQLLRWKSGSISLPYATCLPIEEREGERVWGGLDCGHWDGGSRERFLEIWHRFGNELSREFNLESGKMYEEESEI
jgi:hypothetical protein